MFVKTDTNDVYNLSLFQKLIVVHVPQQAPLPYALMALMPNCDYEKNGDCIVLPHHATHAEASVVLDSLIKQSGGGYFHSGKFVRAE